MCPVVTPSDLLPLDAYGPVRAARRDRIIELKRRRRVTVGRHVSLVFESRETVLHHIQEMLWIERTQRAERAEEEIAEYDRLVPRAGELTATLMIHGGPPSDGQALIEGLAAGQAVVFLALGGRRVSAELLRPAEEPTCPVHYLRFPLDRDAARVILARSGGACLGARYAGETEILPLRRETLDEIALGLDAGWPAAARAAAPLSLVDHQ